MRKVLIATLLLGAIALAPASAQADSNREQITSYKAATEKFRTEMQAFNAAQKSYLDARKIIEANFRNAIQKANQDFKSAMSIAATAEQKSAARSARDTAITTATAARDAAIATIGQAPVKPTPPVKTSKLSPTSKQTRESKAGATPK